MKNAITIILFSLSNASSIGQSNKSIQDMNSFMNNIIKQFKSNRLLQLDTGHIFLSSNSPKYFKHYILTSDTLKDINNRQSRDFFILTNVEKDQMLVDTMKWTELSQKSFQLNNLKLVSSDSIRNKYDPAYLIYKPVFLRNNTVCLFYYDFICNLCGHGRFLLFKKTKKGWKQWIEIGGWVN